MDVTIITLYPYGISPRSTPMENCLYRQKTLERLSKEVEEVNVYLISNPMFDLEQQLSQIITHQHIATALDL